MTWSATTGTVTSWWPARTAPGTPAPVAGARSPTSTPPRSASSSTTTARSRSHRRRSTACCACSTTCAPATTSRPAPSSPLPTSPPPPRLTRVPPFRGNSWPTPASPPARTTRPPHPPPALAPTRKRDPGYRFPWKQLADAGFGLWPDEPLADPPPGFDPWQALRLLGYPLEQDASEGHPAIVRAFHRRFRGDENDVLDAQDARILYSMTRQDMPD